MSHLKTIFLYGTIGMLLLGCEPIDVPPETPRCVKKEIRKTEDEDLREVTKYKFKGEPVYLFAYGKEDSYARVLDDNCKSLCILGGESGITKCQGSDFDANSTYEKEIWSRN